MSFGCRVIALVILVLFAFPVHAEDLDTSSYAVTPPDLFIASGVLVAPLKAAADALGASVSVDGKSYTVTVDKAKFAFTLNSTTASAGGKRITLPKAPFLAVERTYVPFAPLVQAFHGKVVINQQIGYAVVSMPGWKEALHFPIIPLAEWKKTNGTVENALYVVNLDGTGLRRILCNTGRVTDPSFSPDGTRILYMRNGNIYLRHVNQPNEICLLTGAGNIYSSPCFTPDGRYILYHKGVKGGTLKFMMDDGERFIFPQQIFRINPDGTGKRLLADGRLTGISGDGRLLAYMTWAGDKSDTAEMRLMDIDGDHQQPLGKGKFPVLNAAGDRILYLKTFTAEKKKVDLLVSREVAGRQEPALPAPAKDTPTETFGMFAPDGQHILCLAKGLAIMGADRSGVVRLTTNENDREPIFTPDGKTIVFVRGADFSPETFRMDFDMNDVLVSIKPDGSEEIDIVDNLDVQEFAIAPNSRQIILTGDPDIPDDSENKLKEAAPGYTLEDAQKYVKAVVPAIEEVTGRKYTKVPDLLLVKRRQLVPVLAREAEPQLGMLMRGGEINIPTMARQIMKAAAPAVLGKYGLKDRALYLLPGNLDPIMQLTSLSPMHREGLIKLIIAHEMAHALHDQEVGLSGQLAKATTTEKMMALGAVSEGFAMYVQDRVAEKLQINSTAREMARLLVLAVIPSGAAVESIKQGDSSQAHREAYLGGRDFIDWHVQREGMEAVWKIVANPPTKTRVILHPELYTPTPPAEIEYNPLVVKAVERLGIKEPRQITVELGELTMRKVFSSLAAPARDKIISTIDQAFLVVTSGEEKVASAFLITFNDQTQIEPFVMAIEKASRGPYVKGDAQGNIAGISADLNRKRTLTHIVAKETIYSVARGKTLLILDTVGLPLSDKQVAGIFNDLFQQIETARTKTAPPPESPEQPAVKE